MQLFARMLARLGACCWFPQLYTVIWDCTGGVTYARGRVFPAHVSCFRRVLWLDQIYSAQNVVAFPSFVVIYYVLGGGCVTCSDRGRFCTFPVGGLFFVYQ